MAVSKNKPRDNTTLKLKVSLRANLLREVENPIVLETHGGLGSIWRRCYSHLEGGIVIEKDPIKAEALASQRLNWAVYECKAESALQSGLGRWLPINFVDIDPYGDPWPFIRAFFESARPFPPVLGVAVNDGLRQAIKLHGGWTYPSMRSMTSRHGSGNLYKNYLEVCQELLTEIASQRGYSLTRWGGYYCGTGKQMTHYAALLVRSEE
jgi:hypothetical protein